MKLQTNIVIICEIMKRLNKILLSMAKRINSTVLINKIMTAPSSFVLGDCSIFVFLLVVISYYMIFEDDI